MSFKYKGYTGYVKGDFKTNELYGQVLGIDDCIIYQGENIAELQQSFEDAVDEYLDTCVEIGKEANKPN